METEINILVSADLHPRVIEGVEGFDSSTEIYVNGAIESFSAAYDGIRRVHEARIAAEKNGAWTEQNRQLIVAEFAEKIQLGVAKKFDAAMSNMSKTIAAMEGMLSAPLEQSAERQNISAEIRNHVKGLSTKERSAFLSNAHTENDVVTLRAVLGAPGFLSGISEVERTARTKMHHLKNAPDVAKRLEVMKGARQLLEARGGLVLTEVEKAIGTSWAVIKRLREENGKATAALKFES